MATEDLERALERVLLRLRSAHPFFGALALFADLRLDDRVTTAATDGRAIWIAPSFAQPLSPEELGGVVLHELLHCALDHIPRMRTRDPRLWNCAADIVVNGMIRSDTKFLLPKGSVEDAKLAHLSVEEVYEQLEAKAGALSSGLTLVDLLPHGLADEGRSNGEAGGHAPTDDALSNQRMANLARHWQLARHQAAAIARRMDPNFGTTAIGASRELGRLEEPRLPWRDHLWQFVVRTPSDFSGFDRRALWRGMYLDAMDGERVNLRVAIDTSGSIDGPLLAQFLSEIGGILRAYPHLDGQLYFADAALYGPYPLDEEVLQRRPEGGGGTSFIPFFAAVERERAVPEPLCVYFTDGYGDFPSQRPGCPVLWIVAPGGADSTAFPFGTVVRMAGD
jgi:predicted metal-dependent peptidase